MFVVCFQHNHECVQPLECARKQDCQALPAKKCGYNESVRCAVRGFCRRRCNRRKKSLTDGEAAVIMVQILAADLP